MKKYLLIITGIAISLTSIAQDNSTKLRHEMGLSMRSLNQFGIVYRIGNENSVWRINNLFFTNSSSDYDDKNGVFGTDENSSFSIAVGKEFRKELHTNFYFRYGADLYYTSNTFISERKSNIPALLIEQNDKITRNQYGLGFIIGFNYELNDHFLIGAEFIPTIGYFKNEDKGNFNNLQVYTETDITNDGIIAEFSSSNALISLIYRLN